MFSLFKKELRSFFSNTLAYLVLFVFFAVNALALFILPTGFNLFDSGYSTLEPFFEWAPLIFLFLVPSLCMRSFAEEKKSGTIEVLMTRPLSDFQLVISKFLACFLVLVISLLPVFLYLFSVASLSSPAWNFDMAAFQGAFLGLLFLGGAYTAFCVFMSSLTENQVVAFVLSVVGCAILYLGFDLVGAMVAQGEVALFVGRLGMKAHFLSLSRGVVDMRDLMYYIFLIVFFLSLTVWRLERRMGVRWKKYVYVYLLVLLPGVFFSFVPVRLDMTEDRRFTLMPVTKDILRDIDSPVLVKVYLCGDLPSGFKRLEKSVRETLDEFRIYHPGIRYEFVDIYGIENSEVRQQLMNGLVERGISPTQLEVKTKDGVTRRMIFPAAEIRTEGRSVAVPLLRPQLGRNAEQTLNNSVENIEVQLVNAMRALFETTPPSVAFLEGHGELGYRQTVSLGNQLSAFYRTTRVEIRQDIGSLLQCDSMGRWSPRFDVLIVARPRDEFPAVDKLVLDQYLMYGGRILWLLDGGDGCLDSLRGKSIYNAIPYPLGMEDAFFRYGFRLRTDMLLDRNAAPSPVVTGYMGNQPMIEYLPNFYTPVVEVNAPSSIPGNDEASRSALSLIGMGVGNLRLEVPSGIDTIENAVHKTILMETSPYTRKVGLPHAMSADLMRSEIGLDDFHDGKQVVGLLLEGEFPSAFPLVRPHAGFSDRFPFRKNSSNSAMIVVSDGDIAANSWSPDGMSPFPVGFDRYTGQQYSNAELLLNMVHYLTDNHRWIELKPRAVKMRLLDKAALVEHGDFYRWLNLWLPLGCCLVAGSLMIYIRRYRYAKKK